MPSLILTILYIFILTANISNIIYNISIIKISIKKVLIFECILFTISFLLCVNKQNYLLVPISTIVMIIYLYNIFKKIYYCLAVSIFTQLIFALGDGITGAILVFILKLKYFEIMNNFKIQLIMCLIIFLICYVISKGIRIFFKRIYFSDVLKFKSKDTLVLNYCLLLPIISIFFYSIIWKNSHEPSNKLMIVLNLFIIVSFLILTILLTKASNENMKKNLEQKYRDIELTKLKEYTDMLEYVSNDLRCFKHDYINILQIMNQYLKSDDIEGLKKFYKFELLPESKKILEKDICFMLLKHIKLNPFKGFISSKIINAQSKGIKVNIGITEDIEQLSINSIDLCRITGILMDNAIEAAELCDNKVIDFLILKTELSITLIINNSCSEDTPPIHKIYEKDFSTKGIGRGLGLKFVKNIIDNKYTNVLLNTKIENSTFSQEIIINNNEYF